MSLVPAILRTRRSRLFLFAITVFLALILAAQVPRLIHHHEEKKVTAELDAFIAGLDAKEPGWRLADIEAGRAMVSDEENSATIVLAASKLLPETWPPESFGDLEYRSYQNDWPNREELKEITDEVSEHQAALSKALQLESFPRGRFPSPIDKWKGYNSRPDHIADVARVDSLLTYESLAKAYGRDPKEVLRCCFALVNLGRSLGDEPTIISQGVRRQVLARSIACFEQLLSQETIDVSELSKFQKALEQETEFPNGRIAMQGERASAHMRHVDYVTRYEEVKEEGEKYSDVFKDRRRLKECHLFLLEKSTTILKALGSDAQTRNAQLRQIDRDNMNFAASPNNIGMTVCPKAAKWLGLIDNIGRGQAVVQCAMTAIAAERYRMKHDHWPETLEKLAPEFLKEAPLNPLSGETLQMKMTEDQLVIYALESDKKFYDGRVSTSLTTANKNENLGFRLWAPKKRPVPIPSTPDAKSDKSR